MPHEGVKASSRGFTLIELLIVVAIIGIIAAIAIPGLLRARVSAQEAAAVGEVRAVISAEAVYHGAASGYGHLSCLATPSNAACLIGYPPTAPIFLDPSIASLIVKSGYGRVFTPGATSALSTAPNNLASYCYAATPVTVGQTGVKGFGGDMSGRICVDNAGANLCAAASLPAGCTVLGQ